MPSDKLDIDILLYIALAEEFNTISEELESELRKRFEIRELEGIALQVFSIEVPSRVLDRNVRLVVVPAGKMGIKRAGAITTEILARSTSPDVVVLGIAGSLSNDLQPGDVFIPYSVVDYLANSAAKNKGKTQWRFETSGEDLPTSPRLLNRFQFFKFTHREYFEQWQAECLKRHKKVATRALKKKLAAKGSEIRTDVTLFAGDDLKLASGPAVGKGDIFVEWLKREVDRKVTAIEMESAGVYDAVQIRIPQPRVIAIRGISDFADKRKEILEEEAKGMFRDVAAKNALSLLIRGIEAGLFKKDQILGQTAPGRSGQEEVKSLVGSIMVLGGVTEESEDPDAEEPRLNIACHRLGEAIAYSGAKLIICSPFPNSADYYSAMGFASADCDRILHFHSPKHPNIEKKREALGKTLGKPGLTVLDWLHPGPEKDEAWPQAWLLSQLQALENADAVIAVGGKVDKTANTLLHIAEGKGIPIVPFTFLKGAAQRSFDRRNWQKLNPSLDTSDLKNEKGVDKAIQIANQLILDLTAKGTAPTEIKSIFVSRAAKDREIAADAVDFLKRRGFEAILGDEVIRADQMTRATIDQAILASDVCIVLWSQNYALSPWCYDELVLAANLQALGQIQIWFFNIDGSEIVPREGRKQKILTCRNRKQLIDALSHLTSKD